MDATDPKRRGLTPAKLAAAAVLAVSADTDAACRAAGGVSPRTIRRWRYDPEFRAAVRDAARDAHAQTRDRVMAAAQPALDVLLDVIRDPDAPAGVRVRAAQTILTIALAVGEDDLHERVATLEELWTQQHSAISAPAWTPSMAG